MTAYELMRQEYRRGRLYKTEILKLFDGDQHAGRVIESVEADKKTSVQYSLFSTLAVYVRNIGFGEFAKETLSDEDAVEVKYLLLDKLRPTDLTLKGY